MEGSYGISQLLNCFFGEEMDRNAVAVDPDGVDPDEGRRYMVSLKVLIEPTTEEEVPAVSFSKWAVGEC